MDIVLDLLKIYGLPTTLLLALAWHHVRTVKSKDAEIQRVNEARISEQRASTKLMMDVAQEFTKLSGEQEKTLALLADRMQR